MNSKYTEWYSENKKHRRKPNFSHEFNGSVSVGFLKNRQETHACPTLSALFEGRVKDLAKKLIVF